jgi:hypothetical protein
MRYKIAFAALAPAIGNGPVFCERALAFLI